METRKGIYYVTEASCVMSRASAFMTLCCSTILKWSWWRSVSKDWNITKILLLVGFIYLYNQVDSARQVWWITAACQNLCATSGENKDLSCGEKLLLETPASEKCTLTETSGRIWGATCLQFVWENHKSKSKTRKRAPAGTNYSMLMLNMDKMSSETPCCLEPVVRPTTDSPALGSAWTNWATEG